MSRVKQRLNAILESRPLASINVLMILFSMMSFSLETLPNLPPEASKFLNAAEHPIVALFTLEYLARIYTAHNRLRFITSFHGLVDLLAIAPYYLSFAVDSRSLRLLRMLRLLRAFKLGRYVSALTRMSTAFMQAREELAISVIVLTVAIYFSAFGIFYFEHDAQPDKFVTIFDALWWAVATITTVGYGDIYPITLGGRFFTFIVLIIGLGLISIPAGIFASSLLAVKKKQ